MNLVRVTPPDDLTHTKDEVLAHLRLDAPPPEERALLMGYLRGAIDHAESLTGRAFITQTWRLTRDAFCDEIKIPRVPLISVDSVTYIDTAGATQTLATSVYDVDTVAGRLLLAYDQSWPSIRNWANSVSITFTAGYGDRNAVPEAIRTAILWLVMGEYERDPGMSEKYKAAGEARLQPYRLVSL